MIPTREIGDPNKAMGSQGGLNPPPSDWLPHDLESVEDSRGFTLLWRCTRCDESITQEQYSDGCWVQVHRYFTPVCPVWPDAKENKNP